MEDETKPAEPKLILKDFAIHEQPKGPIQFDECWTATIEKIGNELVEKLIARMKEERFLILREPEPCPEGFVELETGGEPIVDFHVSIKAMEDAIKDDTTLEPLLRPGIEALQKPCEQTPDFVKDMYKMPSDDVPIPRMTPEQREQLYKKPEGYFDEHDFVKQADELKVTMGHNSSSLKAMLAECDRLRRNADARSDQIKSHLAEFEKSDWHFFKEFVGREWRAIKVLWKRWRDK